jgi:hypothetical protein
MGIVQFQPLFGSKVILLDAQSLRKLNPDRPRLDHFAQLLRRRRRRLGHIPAQFLPERLRIIRVYSRIELSA